MLQIGGFRVFSPFLRRAAGGAGVAGAWARGTGRDPPGIPWDRAGKRQFVSRRAKKRKFGGGGGGAVGGGERGEQGMEGTMTVH